MKRKETKRAEQLRIAHMSALARIDDSTVKSTVLDNDLFSFLGKSAKMLCLFHADYCCESCRAKENLTLHHLIGKKNKYFMSKAKYFKQRLYYGNQVILCDDCHCKIEYRNLNKWKGHGVITKDLIENTRKELEVTE